MQLSADSNARWSAVGTKKRNGWMDETEVKTEVATCGQRPELPPFLTTGENAQADNKLMLS